MNCSICEEEKILETHHIQSVCYGGSNKKSNLVSLCANCHKMVHYGLIIIEGGFGSLDGTVLLGRKFTDLSITGLDDPNVYLMENSDRVKDKYLKKGY